MANYDIPTQRSCQETENGIFGVKFECLFSLQIYTYFSLLDKDTIEFKLLGFKFWLFAYKVGSPNQRLLGFLRSILIPIPVLDMVCSLMLSCFNFCPSRSCLISFFSQ